MKNVLATFAAGLALLVALSTAFAGTVEQNTYARLMKTGSDRMRAGDYRAAAESFEQALRYDDSSFDGRLGLGLAYFQLHEDRYAERELMKAAGLKPDAPEAFVWLGELSYRKDDLETAISFWEKALELGPSEKGLRAKLDRVKREFRTEKDFNHDITSHFSIKYEGREKIEAGKIVLRILEDAYGEVGRALSFYPDREIQVILYSDQQFQDVTDSPRWSGGLYDGKIRIPVGGLEQETPALRGTLYHEYTHAVVRAITPRCPAWLNEGLAQHFEGRALDARQKDVLTRMARTGKLPSLSSLEGSFMGLNGSEAAYAYLYSLSSVRYLIESFGLYRVKSVLDELGAGAEIATAIGNGITLSYEEIDRGWRRSLE